MNKLNELKQAIAEKQNRLQEMQASEKAAQVLAALIKIHKAEAEKFENSLQQERVQFEKDLENKKALWNKKKAELEVTYNELKEKLVKHPAHLETRPTAEEVAFVQEEVTSEAKTTPPTGSNITTQALPAPHSNVRTTAGKTTSNQQSGAANAKTRFEVNPDKFMSKGKTNPPLEIKPGKIATKDRANPTLDGKPEKLVTNPTLEPLPTSNESIPLVVKNSPSKATINLSSAQKGRSPLGILEASHDLRSQQWYLYSSAKRGIKTPSDVIEIVSVVGDNASSHRGEEVKALLIEKGIKPQNIKVVEAKGDEAQAGKIYIYKM